MDSEKISASLDSSRCCTCGCSVCSVYDSSGAWVISKKRKYDELEGKKLYVPGLFVDSVARVQTENEIVALREMVSSQQEATQDLLSELEEERNASSSAANEAMSMILRLQREKAEVEMEARQFKRLAEEKMGHDQDEMLALEELLYKREQSIQSLNFEIQAYKHRMMSYGFTEAEADGENSSCIRTIEDGLDSPLYPPTYEYPPIKCNTSENFVNQEEEEEDDVIDIDKYAFGETPRDRLKNLEFRIYQMERNPSNIMLNAESPSARSINEKIMIGNSPRRPMHLRKFSADSSGSFFGTGRDMGSDVPIDSPKLYNTSFRKNEPVSQFEEYPKLRNMYDISEGGDDMSDRIYTVDSIHIGVPNSIGGVGICEDHIATPKESWAYTDIADPDIKMLYARLQALEADRESLRHTIVSMQTDKAQLLLLKEIAQQLCKTAPEETSTPRKMASLGGKFSIGSIFKLMTSFIFWRKRARQSKYMFGHSPRNVGLRITLDQSPQTRQMKLLTRTITKARV
ncbi:hypothetical protein SAY86_022935 [Trapa natans]|uniref:GTD-binding domain-containing protein n=1 Tax=Trapa natans TaxID=22666 RepID=A0AAN7R8V0_TRANT|nr:hypothetical protein SAY86_022935 [Trapa natans]